MGEPLDPDEEARAALGIAASEPDYSFGTDWDWDWGDEPEPVVEPGPVVEQAVEESEYRHAAATEEDFRLMRVSMLPHMQGLNEDQLKTAAHLNGPCGVYAGAGSGKTRSVITRIVHLILEEGVAPESIIAITFTRRAAAEMRERIAHAIGDDDAKNVRMQTFHACAMRLLRIYGDYLGLPTRFSMWDESAAARRMREIIADITSESKYPTAVRDYTPRTLLSAIAGRKEAWNPEVEAGIAEPEGRACEVRQTLQKLVEKGYERNGEDAERIIMRTRIKTKEGDYAPAEVQLAEMDQAMASYEELKETANAVDFADLIYKVVRNSFLNPEAARRIGNRWDYVIIDEYQDSNWLQEQFIQLLAGETRNVMVVGDDDQSIYGFRGAKVDLITSFEKRWDGKSIYLGQNYRSWSCIVKTAATVIGNNQERVPKKLWSERGEGGAVYSVTTSTGGAETNRIGDAVQAWVKSGTWKPSDIAVLCRKRKTLRFISNELQSRGVPFVAVGQKPWWQTIDVQLVLSWLQMAVNARDFDAAEQVLSAWPRMGPATIKKWKSFIGPEDKDPLLGEPLLALLGTPRRGPKTKVGGQIYACNELYRRLSSMASGDSTVVEMIDLILDQTGVTDSIAIGLGGKPAQVEESQDRQSRLTPFREAAEGISKTGTLGILELVDEVSTHAREHDEGACAVTVSTMHGSKGLEWPLVICASLVDGQIPTAGGDPAEERRLFYVALTRARDVLIMSSYWTELVPYATPANPSPFVIEAQASGEVQDATWSHLRSIQGPHNPADTLRAEEAEAGGENEGKADPKPVEAEVEQDASPGPGQEQGRKGDAGAPTHRIHHQITLFGDR